MNQNIASFYEAIRSDDAMLAMLAEAQSVHEICAIAVKQGNGLGYDFTMEEAMEIAGNYEAFSASFLDHEELNDFELEMVAAGTPISNKSGSSDIHT